MLDLDDIRRAARAIDGVVHRTPVMTSRTLDATVGSRVALKTENLQRAGSFKLRGAYHRISSIPQEERRRGVVAYSSGNHAQAVALAARLLDIPATIVMPSDAPTVKRRATEGYGAEVVAYDRATGDREAIARDLAEQLGRTLVAPYDDPVVVAGQGTVALELIEDAGPIDVLVVPVGGGGLIAGCATAARALLPDVEVIGVEPATADDTRRSLAAGRRVAIDPPTTIADGLQASVPGEVTFAINQALLADVVTVTDDQIVAAMRFLADRCKLVVEPSGAVGVAALLGGALDPGGADVGVVLSGGNVGSDRLAELFGSSSGTP